MKKNIILLSTFIFTVMICVASTPSSQVFKSYVKDSISIARHNTNGCEISCRSNKGIIKKYTTNSVTYPCTFRLYDFNQDGIEEIFITDDKSYEIIDLSKNLPMKISQEEDFLPINLRFTKNENSYTAYLDNGQSFELSHQNSEDIYIEPTAKISITDFNNDKTHEICLAQEIKNNNGEILYTVNTYRTLKEGFFTISDIKVTEN